MSQSVPQIDPATLRQRLRTWAIDYSNHAFDRLQDRTVTTLEVKHVVRNGELEPGKHEYSKEHGDWAYAVRGKTIDGRNLRVCVAIKDNLLVVTVIDLDQK